MTDNSMFINKRLRGLIFSLAAIMIFYIVFIMAGVTLFTLYQNSVKEAKRNDLNQILVENRTLIMDWISSNKAKVKLLSSDTHLKSLNTSEIIQSVKRLSEQNPDYELIAVIGNDGKSIASSDGKEHDVSDRPYFKQCLLGSPVVYGPLLSKKTEKTILAFSSPIKTIDSVSAVFLALSPLDDLNSKLARTAPGLSGEVYLIDPNGYLLTPSRFEADLKQQGLIRRSSVFELKIQSYAAQQIRNGQSGISEYSNYLGNPVLGSYTRISEPGWGLIVEQNTGEIYKEIKLGYTFLFLYIAFVSLLSLFLVVVSIIRFVRIRNKL